MPCNSDYMEQTPQELVAGRVMLVKDEVFHGKRITAKKWADAGYDKRVYGKGWPKAERDQVVRDLCRTFQGMTASQVSDLSLEAQMWWRDHVAADVQRARDEETAREHERLKAGALAKLSKAERDALGI